MFSGNTNAEESVIEIDSNTKELWLLPGESKTVSLRITSNYNKTVLVYLDYLRADCMDHPGGYFSDSFFKLEPNEERIISFTIKSSKIWFKNEDHNDISLVMYWGENLSNDFDIVRDTSEGRTSLKIEIHENNMMLIMIIVAPIVLFIIVLLLLLNRRRLKKRKMNK
jgi:hypothetical protein